MKFSDAIRVRGVSLLMSCVVSILLVSGCDKVPTFGELTGNEKPAAVPAPPPVQAPPSKIEMPTVKAPPPKTPEMIYEEFLAKESRLRDNKDLKQLSQFEPELRAQIQDLNMADSQLTDEGAEYLTAFPELGQLNIGRTGISNVGLQKVGQVNGLKHLSMVGVRIGSDGLAAIAGLTDLEHLDLSGTSITDKSFEHLLGMTNLQVLAIGSIKQLQGQGIAELAKRGVLKNLRALIAPDTAIANYGVEGIKQMPALETLQLNRTGVTDQQMPLIASRGDLVTLYVESNPISNAGVKHLTKLKNLELLSLQGCKGVDRDAFNFIKNMKNLKTLNVSNTGVTEDAVVALKEKFLPDTVILFNGQEY